MIGTLGKKNGFAQIPLMIALLIMAIAIPLATKLVQQNQDTRSKAASLMSTATCTSKGGYCAGMMDANCDNAGGVMTGVTCDSYVSYRYTITPNCCKPKPTPTPKPLATVGGSCTGDSGCASGYCSYNSATNTGTSYQGGTYGVCLSVEQLCNKYPSGGRICAKSCPATGYTRLASADNGCYKNAAIGNDGDVCCKAVTTAPVTPGTQCKAAGGVLGCIPSSVCTSSLGSYDCSSGTVCCKSTTAATNPTLYFYDPSTLSCSSTTAYASVTSCNTAKKGACFSTSSACTSSYSSCTSAGGKCTSTSTTCTGTRKTGLCPGDSTISCCVPTVAPPAATCNGSCFAPIGAMNTCAEFTSGIADYFYAQGSGTCAVSANVCCIRLAAKFTRGACSTSGKYTCTKGSTGTYDTLAACESTCSTTTTCTIFCSGNNRMQTCGNAQPTLLSTCASGCSNGVCTTCKACTTPAGVFNDVKCVTPSTVGVCTCAGTWTTSSCASGLTCPTGGSACVSPAAVVPVVGNISFNGATNVLNGQTVMITSVCTSNNCDHIALFINGAFQSGSIKTGNSLSYNYTLPATGASFTFQAKGCSKVADSSGNCPTGNMGLSNIATLSVGVAITTPSALVITFSNLTASDIFKDRASLHGTISGYTYGTMKQYWFEYGPGSLSKLTVKRDVGGNSMGVNEPIDSLAALTEYSFRMAVVDQNSVVHYSDVQKFSTTNTGLTQICVPSTFECVDANNIRVCDSTGTQWGTSACPNGCANNKCNTAPTNLCGTCPSGQARVAGDANCDGVIDIRDRSIIVDELVNSLVKNGDLNCDGTVNILDLNLWRDAFLFHH